MDTAEKIRALIDKKAVIDENGNYVIRLTRNAVNTIIKWVAILSGGIDEDYKSRLLH